MNLTCTVPYCAPLLHRMSYMDNFNHTYEHRKSSSPQPFLPVGLLEASQFKDMVFSPVLQLIRLPNQLLMARPDGFC